MKNKNTSDEELKILVKLMSTGEYKISVSYFTNHDENTRFVIIEKYPKNNKNEGTYYMNVNIETIKPVQYIETTFTINKSGEIKYE